MTIYEVMDDEYFKQSDVDFPEYNLSDFIPIDVRNAFQHIGLEYGLFFHNVKIKHNIIAEKDKS